MRVYYDLVIWEDMDDGDIEGLKTKWVELGNRFKGFGLVKFNMRAEQPQPQYTQEEIDAINAQAEQQAGEEQAQQPEAQAEAPAQQEGEQIVDE